MIVIKSIKYVCSMLWNTDKKLFMFSICNFFCEEFFSAFFTIFFIKRWFEYIENGNTFSEFIIFICFFCGIQIVMHILSANYTYFLRVRTPQVYAKLYHTIISKAQMISVEDYEKPSFYDKYSKALDECLTKMISGVNDIIKSLASALAIITTFCIISTIDSFLFWIMIPLIIIVSICTSKRAMIKLELRNNETKFKRRLEYYKRVFYEKKYANDLRLFKIKDLFDNRYGIDNENRYKTNLFYNKKMMNYSIISRVACIGIVQLFIFGYIAYKIIGQNHTANIGGYIAIVTSMQYIASKINGMIKYATAGANNCIFVNNLKEFMEYDQDDEEAIYKVGDDGIEDIQFKDVSFSYNGHDKIFDSLNISIKKGEKIAIVGENGAGKTTLIKLLLGFYKIKDGEIKINNININKINKESYYSHVGTVFQDHQLFAMSLSNNVIMRNADSPEDKELVNDSLKLAGFEKIKSLTYGLETSITKEFDDNGYVCSGGETQKIAIARAFAKNPDLVILDEPSSALDPVAEFNMFNKLKQVMEGKTAFIISHRLSIARLADRIIYLEGGRVLECGTHEQLMGNNGKYAKLYQLQSRNYIEEIAE